jgi:hypothetical protein
MCQHVCYWRVICTDKGKPEVRRRSENDIPPPAAYLRGLVPPAFAVRLAPIQRKAVIVLVFVGKYGPTTIKYVEKRVVVEDVDERR